MDIVIATKNKHKFDEIVGIFEDTDINLIFAGDYPDLPDVVEDGDTLFENALLKAKKIGDTLKMPCIADDTGFYVNSLDGKPGINAAHYAGEHRSYADNNAKVLSELADADDKSAYFQTVTVFYDPLTGEIEHSIGTVNGYVIDRCRGDKGFGYDSIFVPESYEKTYAEMTDDEKNKMSHRYKSISGLVTAIINRKIL